MGTTKTLVSARVVWVVAILATVWPNFVWFRPPRVEFYITLLHALLWLVLVTLMLEKHGWTRLWLVVGLPLVSWWPLLYLFVSSCTQDHSCP